MRISIGGSFLFLRSRKGGDAYERDLNMAGKQSTKSKNQSKPKRNDRFFLCTIKEADHNSSDFLS